MTHTLPSLRCLAVDLVREAMVATGRGGDSLRVTAYLRRRTVDWPRRERERLTLTLAWIAGSLALHVPAAELDQLLGELVMSDDELLERATGHMIAQGGAHGR